MNELSISEYLNEKGITIIGQNFNNDKSMDNKDIISQIKLIVEVHKIFVGCNFNGMSGIRSTIGKEVEADKVQVKKLQKHYDYVVNKSNINEFEKLILLNGMTMLNQAKKSLNYIFEHDYFGVIKRSMNREEICLSKVDRNNLRKKDGRIEISTIKGITYNLVEEDLYNYIKKLQRKQFNIDGEELIKEFVHGSHLSFNSFDYLRAICSYPKDFFKVWEKYMDSRREWNYPIYGEMNMCNVKDGGDKRKTDEELVIGLKKSLVYESRSFI